MGGMERGGLYYGLIATGAVLLWLAFRHGRPTKGRMALIACGIAVALVCLILFRAAP